MGLTRGSKRHALEAIPGVAIPGVASFVGLVGIGKVADEHLLGLVSLAWVTTVFGSAVVGFGPSQAAVRAVATGNGDRTPLHRGLLVRRAAILVPAVLLVGVIAAIAGSALGPPLIAGSVWMAAQSFFLFEMEVLKGNRQFALSSAVVSGRAVLGWGLAIAAAALLPNVVVAVAPNVVVTLGLLLWLRPSITWTAGGVWMREERAIARPTGRLAIASYALGYADRYVLEVFRSPEAVGLYTLGYQLGEGMLELVSAPVASALLPRIVAEWEHGEQSAARRTAQKGIAAVLLASLAVIPVVLLADWLGLLRLVSTDHRLAPVTIVVALAVGVQGTTRIEYALLLAQNRPQRAARCFWQVLALSVLTVPVLTVLFGVVGTAVATFVGYVTLSLFMTRAART